jgi:peptidoglycan/LPS O-acetylase OafA/YrhL
VLHGQSVSGLFPHLLAGLAYLHTLVFGSDNVINNVAWSLEVEIQFYLLVPWLTAVFAVRSARARRTLIAAAIVLCSIVGPLLAGTTPHLENTILRFAQYFLVGFLLADLWVREQLKPAGRRNPLWDVAALACLVAGVLLHTGTGPEPLALIVLPWLCFVAYVAVFRGVAVNALLTLPLLVTIGGMCYSIYLWHNILLNNTLGATKGLAPFGAYLPDLLVQAAIMVPFVIVFSAVFFVLVERPCMDKDWPVKLRARLGWGPRDQHLPAPEGPAQTPAGRRP